MEIRSIEAIVNALNDARVRYVIVGGLAVNVHGFVRITRDVDIVLQLDVENCLRGLRALVAIGYKLSIPGTIEEFADRATRERWRSEKNMIVLKLWSDDHLRTPVDVFAYEPFDFEAEMKRAVLTEFLPGVPARVVSLPTLLEMKRVAGRAQDLADIAELTDLK